ncbi:inactive dipeptidyl peptidase 10-like [Uloborus diversus]|uniref:inactive dipeptidyl peptidase 10-like n=1 Tax=Uloborus diversus TaxID=327109 RepID=UPI00240A4457|nr:inactive dipeptidyl peptidase 10-like [Uloborus diversus]
MADLGSEEEEQRNWRGICIALLVIATVCSLIITSVVLLSPGPEEPRVKNPRFTLEEIINGEYEPRLFNGSWISDVEVTFRDPDGAIVIYNAKTHEKTIIVNNVTLPVLKSETDQVVLRTIALETIYTKYPESEWIHIYTDGSRVADHINAGAGVYSEHFSFSIPVGKYASAFDGEKPLNIQSFSISPDRKYVLISHDHEQVFKHSFTAKYKVFIVETEQMQPFLPDMPNAVFQYVTWGSKGSQMAYVYRNNIYFLPSYGDGIKPTALTQSGEEGVIFNGLPDWVYEAEVFHSNKALWWCPDGSKLAYAVFNDTQVDVMTYPWYGSYEDSTNVYPQTIRLRYPKPGTVNPKASLWVADFSQSLPVTEEVMPPPEIKDQDYYLTEVQWIDENRLLAMWLRRAQNSSIVSICNIADSGWMCHKHMQEDTSYGWVDMYEAPVFSNNKRYYFLRLPVADGKAGRFRHIASFDFNTARKDFLTHGSYDTTAILAYLEEEHAVYYMTTLLGKPEERHLYSVTDLASSQPRKQKCLTCDLDENCLYFNALFSHDAHYFVLECLGPNVPRVELRETLTNQLIEVLDTNSDLVEALDNRALPQIETFKVPLKGGYEASVRLYLPPPLRENEIIKYPLIVHVCGSPGTQLVTEKFQIHWGSYLASHKNYIYAHIDGRGSGFQGDKRIHETFRQLGNVEVEDQLAVASYLVLNKLYVDGEKVALWGWSYGGYMSVSALATPDETFSCGISVAPITNWLYYDSVYSERYMQSPKPEDNYIGYEKSDVSIKAEHIRGKKFLLIHGTADDDVHLQHSMMLIKALTNAGVLFRTQIYPDEKNSLVNVKMHLHQTMEDFLEYTCFKAQDKSTEATNGR